MGYLTDLTDDQWALIEPIIAPQEGPGRPREVDPRRVIDALMYMDRTGCHWRMFPHAFPPSGPVRYSFDKWNADGTLLAIHDPLRRLVREQHDRAPDPTAIVIDRQSVKTTEVGGVRGFAAGNLIKGRKRQLVVATAGNLLTGAVQPAAVQDRDGAQAVLRETQELCPDVTHAWADQRYAGDLVAWAAKALGITIEIVRRNPDQAGFVVLPRRWVVERTIAWVNRCRRVSKDCERLVKKSAAMIYWASIQHMLRRLAPPANQERPYQRKAVAGAPCVSFG